MMSALKSKLAIGKIGFVLLLLFVFVVVLFQNPRPIAVELLLWEVNLSLSFLLLGVALLSAFIVFVTVLFKSHN